jgi:tellurite resistance-related uncharacterized protein
VNVSVDARLPPGVTPYKRTPVFTADTVPAGLLRDHSTKEGCWALIHVFEGRLLYVVEDSRRAHSATLLVPDEPPGLIEPTIVHRVEPKNAVRFQVEFFRSPASNLGCTPEKVQ